MLSAVNTQSTKMLGKSHFIEGHGFSMWIILWITMTFRHSLRLLRV